jgi:hypothetical protein
VVCEKSGTYLHIDGVLAAHTFILHGNPEEGGSECVISGFSHKVDEIYVLLGF